MRETNEDYNEEDKLRLVPSLWSVEESQKIVDLWNALSAEEKNKEHAQAAAQYLWNKRVVSHSFVFVSAPNVRLGRIRQLRQLGGHQPG
jgi:hypothetical protein